MAACAGVQRLKSPSPGEQTKHQPLRFELEKWYSREARFVSDVRLVKTAMGQPGSGPGAGRMKNSHPYRKAKLKIGWHIGNWRSDQRLCLYHPETRTALSLVTGENVGKFGLPWTAEDDPMFVDIDNVDFCVDPTTIIWKDRLDDAGLEAAIGDKLRLVLAGNSPPDRSQQLQFKPATIYMDTSTMQRKQVAIVGSPEHSNLRNMEHVLVAEVTADRAANIEKITKAKKEHLVRMTGRHRYCNVDKLLADIRRVYFPNFATNPQEIIEALGGYAACVAEPALPTGIVNIQSTAPPPYQDGPRFISFTSPETFHNTIRHQGLHRETVRMRTFETWPPSSPVAPKGLVQAGFFYVGKEIDVECFVCGGVKGTWKCGDDPLQCHEDMDGWCEFVLGYDVGNIPMEDDCGLQEGQTAQGQGTWGKQEIVLELQEFKRLQLEKECIICMNAERSFAFFPCGHLAVCSDCATNVFERCPLCRHMVDHMKKIYFA